MERGDGGLSLITVKIVSVNQNPTVAIVGDFRGGLQPSRLHLDALVGPAYRQSPLELAMLVPGGADDVRPVRGKDGCGIRQIGSREMLLEGNRGVVVQ